VRISYFITATNYRNGDEEGTAMAIERELSRRFGSDQVYFASKSIRPGKDYVPDLLNAVHNSKVLLAVIGSRWLTAVDEQGRKRVDKEVDWTRKEIVEALDHGVPVIPVLVGRSQSRLSAADLPPELARLVNLQSCRLDTHNSETDLRKLGDEVARLVPSLVDSDQPEESAEPDADNGLALSDWCRRCTAAGSSRTQASIQIREVIILHDWHAVAPPAPASPHQSTRRGLRRRSVSGRRGRCTRRLTLHDYALVCSC
jgi:hypothetical protein